MRTLAIILAGAAAALPALAPAQDEETATKEEKLSYLPASVYPAAYVYGGAVEGPTYDAAAEITALAREVGNAAVLRDVETMAAFGFGVDCYVWKGLCAGVKLTHEVGRRRGATLKYDITLPRRYPYRTEPIQLEEEFSYRLQNVDYKVTLKYVLFPTWPVTPFGAIGIGGNSTVFELKDKVSDPVVQKRSDGVLFGNSTPLQYSFDYAWYAGLQANLGDHLFLQVEYNADRQFRKHKIAGYEYDTSLEGIYFGAGWRFDY